MYRMLSHGLIGLCLLLIAAQPAARAEPVRLTAVVGLLSPLSYFDDQGNLTGAITEVMRLIGRDLPAELQLSPQPFARAIRMAELGEGDLFHFYRAPFLQPYLTEIAPIACFRDVVLPRKGVEVTELQDLKGVSFAYIRGSYFDRQLRDTSGLNGTALHDIDVMLRVFRAGRVDAVIGNELLLRSFALRHGEPVAFGRRHVLVRIVSSLYMPVGRKLPDDLRQQVAMKVERLRAEGRFDALLSEHSGIPYTSCAIDP